MSFRINTNIASLQSREYLRTTSEDQAKAIGRVTSGLRILSSGDDAAGLSIANSFRSDQAVLQQGIRNANDGLSTLYSRRCGPPLSDEMRHRHPYQVRAAGEFQIPLGHDPRCQHQGDDAEHIRADDPIAQRPTAFIRR